MAFSAILPYQYVAIRLPSDQIQVEQTIPNTLISLGKYGSFRTNQIIGRPYHLTFEILDRNEAKDGRELRIVPAAELHAATLVEQAETDEASTPFNETEGPATPQQPRKTNMNTHDDPTNQKLTMAEIEALKQNSTGSGRELIEKIMESHSTLDQKTAFSLAKYTLRKHKKFLKRFTVLPLDVVTLVDWMFADREFGKIMEMRNEAVGLIGCWANVHAAGEDEALLDVRPSSRYLLVDDTGGLLVAAMAERMGILHQTTLEAEPIANAGEVASDTDDQHSPPANQFPRPSRQQYPTAMSAQSNTITLVHANQQPNLGLLQYLNFDSNNPNASHPLYTHLKTLSWLQLLDPETDIAYKEPEVISGQELATMKSNRRSAYYRKRRRWERVKSVVDETRAGGFDGLIVASFTDPTSILRHLVPLLAGGSQVVVYSATVEPLVELADCYSTARRTAFINSPADERSVPSRNFPLDPTLLLGAMVQTSRVRRWQVLPGRTHPLMTGRGGAEGYIFSGTRVIPAEGKVEARGRPPRGKKAKAEENTEDASRETAGQELFDSVKDDTMRSPIKRQKIEEHISSATEGGVPVPLTKPMVEENNELEAQLAAERQFIDSAREESGQSPLEAEKVVELVVQEAEEDEMPVLGPATEALKEEMDEKDDVQMSIET
ncbi:tRNA (adenine(58)-N(1))-methyltransferase non-catalytic subunit trm6 [Cladophialophora carrionii]|uniref:tRNA (adenine(58)-N(1))-methyltransferase non-catalytic subunit TRM6 n=1 Tax=Cladophialophora carrionii TaxID=86049 RepID=A0A1C1CVX0_9EURO|nr:tRNA (adenine(58)-N(1))-methyltransferase non-catalytic subunit trm6 [Cladophialophora carrionii]